MRFFTTEKLGDKQSLTPEGFLLCEDVPIARTGEMIYGPAQTTLPTGPSGIVTIRRTDREVFRPQTIASFEGKPFVIEHPDQPDPDRWTVDPLNWAMVAKGHVIGPHRGTGADDDVILADVLVTDIEAIDAIKSGKREVSCGYIADYVCDDCGSVGERKTWNKCSCEQPRGFGQQIGILGNHVALVDSGRCGPRCAIGDSAIEEKTMTWMDSLKAALKSKDQGAFDEAVAAIPAGKKIVITKDGVCDADEEEKKDDKKAEDQDEPDDKKETAQDKSWKDQAEELTKRQDKTEDRLRGIAKDVKDIKDELFKFRKSHDQDDDEDDEKKKDTEDQEEEDEPVKTGDRRSHDTAELEDAFQETLAYAEILSPGFRIPTFDASNPKRTQTTMCRTRRSVLDIAYGQADMRPIIDELLRGKIVHGSFTSDKALTCDLVQNVFQGAAVVKKSRNNDYRSPLVLNGSGGGTGVRGIVKTPADFNKRMKEMYKDLQ